MYQARYIAVKKFTKQNKNKSLIRFGYQCDINQSCQRQAQIAGQNVIAVNNGDSIKSYLNTGRFNTPSGTMTRVEFLMDDYTPLYTELKHGGMVWTTLN